MSDKLSLDNSSYPEIYEKAMDRLRTQAPWWSHRELSDPGITLLEMWALLSDMQSYYMDQVQESHYRKYLKLLGCRQDPGACARVWIFFDHVTKDCRVPAGTKILADRMVFETEEEIVLRANKVKGFYQNTNQNANRNQAKSMYMFRKNRFSLQQVEGEEMFSFTLEQPVEPGEELRFFVLLDEKGKRNPAARDFSMVRLGWEYLTEQGWVEAGVLRDDTCGLLYSGCISLHMKEKMLSGEDRGYEIRCRILEGAYDAPPALYRICLHAVTALQKNTLSMEEMLIPDKRGCIVLRSYLAGTGELRVFTKGYGNAWRDITADCHIDPPVRTGDDHRRIQLPGETYPDRVKVVSCLGSFPGEYMPCNITGVTSQEISLPWDRLKKDSVKLMLRSAAEEDLYREYTVQEPEEDGREYAWHWQEDENTIVLGDGRHGAIPEPAQDGLLLTSLVLWEGEKGNLSIGRLGKWEKPELFGEITCTNYMTGREGRDALKPSEQFAKMKGLLQGRNRMVTAGDIRRIAMDTPGLMIREASAAWRNGMIEVTIYPAVTLTEEYCRRKYRRCVQEYLEPYRMLGSRISVIVE